MKKFALLGLISLSTFTLVGCSSGTTNSNSKTENKVEQSSSTTKQSKQEVNEKKTYKIGDKLVFENGIEFTITAAQFTDERNEFDDTNPEKVVKVTYNVVNNSKEDYFAGSDIELFVGSSKMDTYPLDVTMENIPSGRNYENAVAAFGVNGTDKIELEVKPSFSLSNEKYIVALDLQ